MSNRDLQVLLIRNGLLTLDQVRGALAATQGTQVSWLERLIIFGVLDEEDVCRSVGAAYRLTRCSRAVLEMVPAKILALLPPELALEHRAIPVGLEDGDLRLAMVDPTDADAAREIEFFTGLRPQREVALASAVAEALQRHYGAATALSPEIHGNALHFHSLSSMSAAA
jgi:type IV pilus assembly protein PilB